MYPNLFYVYKYIFCLVTSCRDHRNLGLVGMTDGVPLFDNKQRGLWPFFSKVANLPDSLSSLMVNVHLTLLSANEYYVLNTATKTLKREIHAPRSLKPHLTVLVDDLYDSYRRGIFTTDSTVSPGRPGRHFRCKCVLLFWTGDYPAQALVSGMHSKCCHWCHFKGDYIPEVNRKCWLDHRQCLGTIVYVSTLFFFFFFLAFIVPSNKSCCSTIACTQIVYIFFCVYKSIMWPVICLNIP